jgi:ADP-ribose pyrophosphatase
MSTDYKVISTKTLFDHSWAKIVVDTIEHQGTKRPYFYVASPVEAVATVGLNSEDEIILTQQYRHPVREVIYDLPAGRLEVGESPLDGARREFEEETGYYPNHIEPLGYYNQFPGTLRAGTNLFFARDLTPTKQILDEGEELNIVMMAIPDVLEMILRGSIIDGSLQLGVLLALSKDLLDPRPGLLKN